MFFLNQDTNGDRQSLAPAKKVLATKLNRNALPMKNKTASRKVSRSKTRSVAQEELIQLTRAKITEHQRELHTCLQMDGLEKYSEGGGGMGRNEGKLKGRKRFQSYRGKMALPREVEASGKNNEGEFTYLRVNFQTPGQFAGKEDTPFEDPDITDLKKEVNKHKQQKKEMADVIEQDVLVEIKGRRPLRLPEVFSPMGSQKIDILFSNMKHLFFQLCNYKAWEMCDLQTWLSILNVVHAGDIDGALEDLHAHHPSTAEAQEGFLLFQLCCHKFVKHILAASAALQHVKDVEKDVVHRAHEH
ncbi:hypothetical protein WOLCODRAFT_152076 [Wolfiporia cocos MD-104 SS10]|uniref:FACT complex subunit SPT16 middle domain-containing protein n=1 Tax=Wolfiporia cocos (strain MD-104) TaxID=742152 RepID=A0A2H3JKG5_WOLCO|nr:hypothetical protein WOLCODRAFT_152076 [Wolfiporia cocos MD-104 SS10]